MSKQLNIFTTEIEREKEREKIKLLENMIQEKVTHIHRTFYLMISDVEDSLVKNMKDNYTTMVKIAVREGRVVNEVDMREFVNQYTKFLVERHMDDIIKSL